MRASVFLAVSLSLLFASFQSRAAGARQEDKVDLTVVRQGDHVQVECNPVGIDTAMHGDWKAICNELAAVEVRKLAAAGTIAPIKGLVFDLSTTAAPGATLSRSIALSKPRR